LLRNLFLIIASILFLLLLFTSIITPLKYKKGLNMFFILVILICFYSVPIPYIFIYVEKTI